MDDEGGPLVRVTALLSWFEQIVAVQIQCFKGIFGLEVKFLLVAGSTISRRRRRLWIDSTKQSRCEKTSVRMGMAQSRRPWRMSRTAMFSLIKL